MQKTRLSRSAVNRQNPNDGDCVVMWSGTWLNIMVMVDGFILFYFFDHWSMMMTRIRDTFLYIYPFSFWNRFFNMGFYSFLLWMSDGNSCFVVCSWILHSPLDSRIRAQGFQFTPSSPQPLLPDAWSPSFSLIQFTILRFATLEPTCNQIDAMVRSDTYLPYLSSSLPPSPRHQASINTQQRTSLQNLTPQKPIWKQETLCLTQTTCTTWNPKKETTRLHCSVGHSICAHPPPRSPGRWLCKFVCPQLQLEHRQNTCLPAEYA